MQESRRPRGLALNQAVLVQTIAELSLYAKQLLYPIRQMPKRLDAQQKEKGKISHLQGVMCPRT